MIKSMASRNPGRVPPASAMVPPETPQVAEGVGGGAIAGTNPPDPQVPERAKRRTFTAEYKRRILREADACTGCGDIGALLRREGLYSSHLNTWRRQQAKGLEPATRGRKSIRHPLEEENKRLLREKAALERRLKRAELINDIQKKVSEMLGIPLNSPENEGGDS